MNTNNTIRANGKLLISGEYLVMNGARALAFPIRFGQQLNVEITDSGKLEWISKQQGKIWFTAEFNPESLSVQHSSHPEIASALWRILQSARSFNPDFLLNEGGIKAEIEADYPLEWGLGSSSSLISLIARWSGVDALSLFRSISGGSGYDLACATRKDPFFYQLVHDTPTITLARPGNALLNSSVFAWLGNKQNSQTEIERYRKSDTPSQRVIDRVSELASEFCKAEDVPELIEIIEEHEYLLSSVLKKPVLMHERFRNFAGAVKSLGAWGGDFAMFTADLPMHELKNQLRAYGIEHAFTWNELRIAE